MIAHTLDMDPRTAPAAPDLLLEASYGELRALARSYLRGQRAGHTLQPTALVHEAYLRLARRRRDGQGAGQEAWPSREQFLAAAARTMRRILVNHACGKSALKRGGGARRLELDAAVDELARSSGDARRLDDALSRLARVDARQAAVVEMRFLLGLTVDETAEALDVSPRTVEREWRMARAWLRTEIDG